MDACTGVKLTPQDRRGIRVFAQSLGVTASKDLHQPAIEVVHRMVHDRPESPVVFSVRLLNVIAQSHANVFVRAACLHRSEEHTSELQSLAYLVCRLLLEKKKK